jgi:tRNA dimethylallyltransferase
MEQEKKIILLSGPTASGKSILAIKLAKYFNGEIINADSMQIYKEFSILTSKPSLKEKQLIRHHLYGIHSVKKNFSTGHWLEMAIKEIEGQWEKDKTPIIVGGTGLYFKALTDGLVKIPEIPIIIKNQIRKLHKEIGQKEFFNQLIKLDPLSEKFVVPTDAQRSMRVYEVKKFTNKSLFDLIKKTKSNFNNQVFKKLFINTPKELLHTKIEERVEAMFKDGAIKEVEKFLKLKIYRELSANKIIGVKEIAGYLKGKTTITETKKLITLKTRQYAKRQFTWARGHMKSWEMIYSTNVNDLFKKVVNKIS